MSGRTKIGIVAALSFEVDIIHAQLEDLYTETIADTVYYSGHYGKYDVVIMQCGMAKVSAAAATQALISVYRPDYIINTGCAGALAEGLNIGDIVLSTGTAEWDIDLTAIGLPRGYVQAVDSVEIAADSSLREKLKTAVPADLTICEGLVVSGDQFVSENAQRRLILDSFPGALCAEMEGAAVGHVCAQNEVPFCVLRCMSDTADGNSGVNFAEFSKTAGETSASILLNFLGAD